MKKLFSVLLAVLMMSVAFAQMPFRTVNSGVRDFSVAKQAIQVSNPRHAAGMPAAKETYNYTSVVYTAYAYNNEGSLVQDPETNVESVYDWYLTMTTADGDKFVFDILGSTIVSGQTYTLADMDAYYTGAILAGEETGWHFAAASFTYTNNNGNVTIVAQVTDSAGNIFNVNYAPVTFDDATDTIEVVIPNAAFGDYTADQGAIQMYGFTADSVYYATVAAQATQVVGNYVFADFYTNYTYVYRYYDQQQIVLVDGHATVSTSSDGYMMDAYLLGGDNHVYHVTMTYAIPSLANALDTTEVVIVNPTFTDYTSEDYSYYFMGYTVDSAYFAQINYYSHNLSVTGYFPFDSLYVQYCNVAINNEYTTSIDGHVTVTENNGAYDVDAYLMDEDYHAYHVTMHYVIPVAEDTIDVLVSQAAMEQIPGGWYSSASVTWTGTSDDETYDVNVSYYSSDVDGVFPFVNITSDTKINNVTFVSGHVTVSATNDGHQLEAYLLGNDSHCYHINMNYTVPTMEDAIDTIDIVIPSASMVDVIETQGMFQFYGYDEDEYYYTSVVASATQLTGSYDFEDFNMDYTKVYEGQTSISVVAGHFTVTATATGYEAEAYLLGANLHCYHVTMTYTIPVANDTVDVVIPAAMLNDLTATSGVFQMRGYTADSATYVSVAAYSDQVPGSYVFDDFYGDYTLVYDVLLENQIDVVSGDATVTVINNGYAMEAYLLGSDLHCYHVTMTYTESGINTVSNDQVRVYPNPATDMIHVEANGITRIEVIDLAGRVALTSAQNVNTINVSGLANGVYMLRTTTTEGVNVQKIVKK